MKKFAAVWMLTLLSGNVLLVPTAHAGLADWINDYFTFREDQKERISPVKPMPPIVVLSPAYDTKSTQEYSDYYTRKDLVPTKGFDGSTRVMRPKAEVNPAPPKRSDLSTMGEEEDRENNWTPPVSPKPFAKPKPYSVSSGIDVDEDDVTETPSAALGQPSAAKRKLSMSVKDPAAADQEENCKIGAPKATHVRVGSPVGASANVLIGAPKGSSQKGAPVAGSGVNIGAPTSSERTSGELPKNWRDKYKKPIGTPKPGDYDYGR